jgi:hypothetical protein
MGSSCDEPFVGPPDAFVARSGKDRFMNSVVGGESAATRILEAWIRLEEALRAALPVCSVQPPTQPAELLAALRINHRIGPLEEARILALRETRNQAAHSPEEPSPEAADRFAAEVEALKAHLAGGPGELC